MKKIKSIIFFLSVILMIFSCQEKVKPTKLDIVKKEILKLYNSSKIDSFSISKRRQLLKKGFELSKNNNFDSLELKMLNYNVILYREERKYKEAIKASRKLLNVALFYKDKESIGEAYYKLGLYHNRINQKDSAYYFYNKSLKVYKDINNIIKVGRRLLNIAIIESDHNDYISSNATSVKALKYLKNENKYLASVYNNLGINFRKERQYDRAIFFYNKALALSEKEINKVNYKNNIANVYRDLKKYNKGISILEETLQNFILDKNNIIKLKMVDNLAYTRWLQDSTTNVLSDFIEVEKTRLNEQDYDGLMASYSHLSDYFNKKNKKKSLSYAYKMLNIAKKQKSTYDIIEALDKIKELEKPSNAIKVAIERSRLKDSVELAKDEAQNKYALIKYESTENEKRAIENKLLAETEEKQKQLWFFIGLVSLLTLITYFFYKRQKTKKEKVIEVYKTETRLAKKIHDELANDVFLVMNKAQDATIKNTALLPDLEKIYTLTRDISHENSMVYTGNEFENHLKQLFSEFNKKDCKVFIKGLTNMNINNLKTEKQIVVYRTLNELLVNMKKHSKATLVVINFSEEKGTISINYKDNGVGVAMLKSKHGLQNMETRIKSINGLFSFDSEEGKGFKANIQFKK